METVLNVGLNDRSVLGLVKASGDERFALDSYRRLIQMFGKTVLGVDGEAFGSALDAAKGAQGVETDVELEAKDLQEFVEEFKQIIVDNTGEEFPQEPRRQLDLATRPAATGILTSRGGKTSHAVVVARGMGKTAVLGAESLEVDAAGQVATACGVAVREGDVLSTMHRGTQRRLRPTHKDPRRERVGPGISP